MYLSNCETNLDALKQVTSQLESELSLLQSKLDETIPKPKKYVEYPNTNNYVVATSRYSNPTLGSHVTDMFKFRNGWDRKSTIKERVLMGGKVLGKFIAVVITVGVSVVGGVYLVVWSVGTLLEFISSV